MKELVSEARRRALEVLAARNALIGVAAEEIATYLNLTQGEDEFQTSSSGSSTAAPNQDVMNKLLMPTAEKGPSAGWCRFAHRDFNPDSYTLVIPADPSVKLESGLLQGQLMEQAFLELLFGSVSSLGVRQVIRNPTSALLATVYILLFSFCQDVDFGADLKLVCSFLFFINWALIGVRDMRQ
ncbi:hypothetical protein HK098_006679 [Nowakowskiella sp. JEL0407]|nr:hypothetical protein HK098_006679 [Nowakowskiella sp. JEL0407]